MKREIDEDSLFEIIVGTYEEYLVGFKFILTDDAPKLIQTVANHSHKGSLKCLATYDRYLASGGSDENIHLYDFKVRKQGGMLMHHSGTVTCMKFTPDGSHLVTCGEDGSIAIVAVGSWMLRKIWPKAHKEQAVHWITIHPTGRLALSIGADKTIKTWNLIKGKHAYTTNIASVAPRPEFIEWSSCGEYFGLVYGTNVDIYSMATGAVTNTVKVGFRITCIQFLENQRFCVGTWEGSVICHEFLTGNKIWEIESKNEVRIKSVAVADNWLVVGNSEGNIFVYALKKDKKPKEKASIASSCRITCLVLSRMLSDEELKEAKKKRKRKSFATGRMATVKR
uniref:p21-activated protein kinase-interacting protein 1 n=1 Tax=Lygus hesperus TaxID=30085 RepID=A0A0A9W3E6_LYGHE